MRKGNLNTAPTETIVPIKDDREFSLLIGANIWNIQFCTLMLTGDVDLDGLCDFNKYTISIKHGLTGYNLVHTLFHEISHAIMKNHSYYPNHMEEEGVCDIMGEWLPLIIAQLPSWIFEIIISHRTSLIKFFTGSKKKGDKSNGHK